ncbi:MAG: hypothetical protein MUE72_09720, partial [Chitinophagaceae bacterium]|nr:hypothetical protein [Chitinophagaceae bacterium]
MNIRVLLLCMFIFFSTFSKSQKIDLLFQGYTFFFTLPENLKLGDTAILKINSRDYVKVVFFDFRGSSYFESYESKKLKEKGFYANSLDTLKK